MSLTWEDERYVRHYTRDTTSWVLGPWEARAVLGPVMRKLDRAGVVDMGAEGLDGLAALVMLPPDVVRVGMAWWLSRGSFEQHGTALVMPHFIAAQEASQSNRQRQRAHREKSRDLARLAKAVTKRSDPVTPDPDPSGGTPPGAGGPRHETSAKRDETNAKRNGGVTDCAETVTPCCAVPYRAVPGERAGAREDARSARPRDPMGESWLGDAWCDGVEEGNGHRPCRPSRAEARRLVDALDAHAPPTDGDAHAERCALVRERAKAWAKTAPRKVSVYAFVDALNTPPPKPPTENETHPAPYHRAYRPEKVDEADVIAMLKAKAAEREAGSGVQLRTAPVVAAPRPPAKPPAPAPEEILSVEERAELEAAQHVARQRAKGGGT